MLRKNEMYLDPDTENEKAKVLTEEEYVEESLLAVFQKFYGKPDLISLLLRDVFLNNN